MYVYADRDKSWHDKLYFANGEDSSQSVYMAVIPTRLHLSLCHCIQKYGITPGSYCTSR